MNILILDTNTLLADPQFIFDLDLLPQYQVVILKPVLDELDHLKSKDGETGVQAREASRFIENLILNSPKKGNTWKISPKCELILDEETIQKISSEDRRGSCDDQILASMAVYLKNVTSNNKSPLLVTLDRNMRIRAEARDLPCISPGMWLSIMPNTFVIPIATYGILWSANGDAAVRLPVNLGELGEGWIEIWPHWGYSSGLVSTIHFRLLESNNSKESETGFSSPVLILSTENNIRYIQQMGTIPYKILNAAKQNKATVYHKGWKLELEIRRCEIMNPIKVPQSVKNEALANLAFGVSRLGGNNILGSFVTGTLIGQSLGILRSESNSSLVFSRLSMVVNVSEAPEEEYRKFILTEKAQKEIMEKERIRKSNQQKIIVFLFIGLCASPYILCLLVSFLADISSRLFQ